MKPLNQGILAFLYAPALATARDLITGIPGFGPQTTQPRDGCSSDPNNFGGVVRCITLTTTAPSVETGCPSDPNNFVGIARCIPISQVLSPSAEGTLIPLTGTVTSSDASVPTITVTWTVSDVTLTTTASGVAVPSSRPVWVCTGSSCVNGFPWPQPPIQNPPDDNNGAPVGSSTTGSSTTQISTTQSSATDSSQSSITSLPATSFTTSGFIPTTQNGQTTVVPVVVPQTVQCTQVCSVSSTQTNAPATTTCAPDPVFKRQAGQCGAADTQTSTATTTTFTTISATGELCAFTNCGAASTLCPLHGATPRPTNSPDAKIPTATDFLTSPAKAKRAPEDALSRDFLDPNTFPGGRNAYYSNVQGLIDTFGPHNAAVHHRERAVVGLNN
ncbi:hypothetical protein B0J14DRAFT_650217 [Halenospora varia]|nr:hypothetical protein B0J14DRAFT_650217 [Halenospora varia]